MRRFPSLLSFSTLAGIFLIGAGTLPLEAQHAPGARRSAPKPVSTKTAEAKPAPKTTKAKEAAPRVRTSAIRDEGGTIRYVNRRGKTELEVTPALSGESLGKREQVINRRDDNTPTITSPPPVVQQDGPEVVIDVRRQRLLLMKGGKELKTYQISTSRFGLGDRYHSYKTPVGRFKVDGKIGGNLPMGAVLKGGRFTGEVLQPNAPGRDPIVTRMIRLRGMERRNANAYGRGIFIHGTPDEKRIGKPVSWGCVRMRSVDVVDLYARIGDGTSVTILHPDESPSPGGRSWFANLFGSGEKEVPGT